MCSAHFSVCACADSRLWRHESRVDRERVAAQPGFASVPQLLHGVSSGCADAGPPDQEGPAWPAQDGGQLPQVHPKTAAVNKLRSNHHLCTYSHVSEVQEHQNVSGSHALAECVTHVFKHVVILLTGFVLY